MKLSQWTELRASGAEFQVVTEDGSHVCCGSGELRIQIEPTD